MARGAAMKPKAAASDPGARAAAAAATATAPAAAVTRARRTWGGSSESPGKGERPKKQGAQLKITEAFLPKAKTGPVEEGAKGPAAAAEIPAAKSPSSSPTRRSAAGKASPSRPAVVVPTALKAALAEETEAVAAASERQLHVVVVDAADGSPELAPLTKKAKAAKPAKATADGETPTAKPRKAGATPTVSAATSAADGETPKPKPKKPRATATPSASTPSVDSETPTPKPKKPKKSPADGEAPSPPARKPKAAKAAPAPTTADGSVPASEAKPKKASPGTTTAKGASPAKPAPGSRLSIVTLADELDFKVCLLKAPAPVGVGVDAVLNPNATAGRCAGREPQRLLMENWARRNRDREAALVDQNKDRTVDFDAENDTIARVRKDNVFKDDMTAEEHGIVGQRVALAQQRFAEFQRNSRQRKLGRILSVHDHLSAEEATRALEDCGDDEEAAVLKFTEPDALAALRKTIALELSGGVEPAELSLSDEQRAAYERLLQKRSTTLKKSATSSDKQKMYNRVPRLRLDDALKQLSQLGGGDLEKAMEGWSEARIRAYKLIRENPNAYYYRFNAPGEQQRNGKFTAGPRGVRAHGSIAQAEHKLFMDRLREVGADGQWGVFSMALPGRVGYQCSNYYRQLIARGEVKDPNYFIDNKGKAHYLFSTKKDADGNPTVKAARTFSRKKKHGDDDGGDDDDDDDSGGDGVKRRRASASGGRRGRGKGRRDWDEDEDDLGDEWDLDNLDPERIQADQARYKNNQWKTTKRTRAMMGEAADDDEEEQLRLTNPLPDHIDPITLEKVVKPAISPYGHVMSYSSWIKCLSNAEVCPLTKKPLKKTDLVLLTHANIDRYRDKIVE